MLRTFSKIYGLASLRIGWCYASKIVAEALNKVRSPFNTSSIAQSAAIAALEDDEFCIKSKEHNKKWLEIFFTKLADFKKIKAYPSVANFILLDFFNEKNATFAMDFLLKEGIILREMQEYNLEKCLRMTIGNEEENLQLLENLKKIDELI